jgi:uncharacterized protein (UPF0218 family)
MNLQQIKDNINKAGFSSAGLALINVIMDKAIERGRLEKTEKNNIDNIIDIEIEAAKIIADAKKEIAKALNDYADGIDAAIGKAADDLELLDKSLSEGVGS